MTFLVLGLPRSRTAWLSNFLTYGDRSLCYHDLSRKCNTLDDFYGYTSKPFEYVGVSDTALHMYPWFDSIADKSRILVIKRDVSDSINSSLNLLQDYNKYDIINNILYNNYVLSSIIDKYKPLVIDFNDIDNRLEDIWNYLLPNIPYNRYRTDLLLSQNIQTNIKY